MAICAVNAIIQESAWLISPVAERCLCLLIAPLLTILPFNVGMFLLGVGIIALLTGTFLADKEWISASLLLLELLNRNYEPTKTVNTCKVLISVADMLPIQYRHVPVSRRIVLRLWILLCRPVPAFYTNSGYKKRDVNHDDICGGLDTDARVPKLNVDRPYTQINPFQVLTHT